MLLLFAAAALFAADDPWTKVKELKSGTEIAIFRKGATKPLEVKLDEVREDAVVVVNKKEQVAIPREEIDRLDYRPSGRKVTSEVKHTVGQPDPTPPTGMDHGANVPGNTYSSGVTFTKPGYETIYRRPSPAPKK
jgi:hypothetical protein